MSKQVSVTVQAIDQLTGPARAMAGSIVGIGTATETAQKRGGSALKGLVAAFTSLRGLVTTALGGLAIHRLASSFTEAATEMDKIAKASARLGISVEALSSLRYTADQANIGFEQLAAGIKTAEKNIGQFVSTGKGDRGAVAALQGLNVQLTDGRGNVRAMAELLPDLADGINKIADPAKRLFLAEKIFGDASFLNLIAEGGARLRFFNEEARRLGVVFTPEQVAIAERYKDAIGRVSQAWFGLRARLVTEVGPALTEGLNRLAEFTAAVPEILRNAVDVLASLFGGGPERARAQDAVARFVQDLITLASVAAHRGVQVLLAGVLNVLSAAPALLQPVLEGIGRGIVRGLAAPLTGFADLLLNATWVELAPGFRSFLVEWKGAMEDGLKELDEQFGDVEARTDAFSNRINDALLAPRLDTWRIMGHALQEVAAAHNQAAGSLDRLLGISRAIAAHRIPGLPERPPRGDETPADRSPFEGVIAGLKQFAEQSAVTFEKGAELARGMAGAVASGLTTALVDAVSGVKSLGDAFREFAASTLRMLSEVILKMLIVRAIGVVIGAFSGVPVGNIGGPGGAASFSFPGASVGANTGGLITGPGVERYAFGGMVPGPNVNRDLIPALLTPGEFVLNRAAVQASDLGLLHRANRGEGVRGGGEIHVHVHQQVVVQGGGAPGATALATVKRAAQDGVLEALRTRPGFREEMRKSLS